MTENTKIVFNYLKEHDGEDMTANDIAEALGLTSRSVNGILTAALQRHRNEEKEIVPLIARVPGEIEDPETGVHKAVKFIQLTEVGREFDPDAE